MKGRDVKFFVKTELQMTSDLFEQRRLPWWHKLIGVEFLSYCYHQFISNLFVVLFSKCWRRLITFALGLMESRKCYERQQWIFWQICGLPTSSTRSSPLPLIMFLSPMLGDHNANSEEDHGG